MILVTYQYIKDYKFLRVFCHMNTGIGVRSEEFSVNDNLSFITKVFVFLKEILKWLLIVSFEYPYGLTQELMGFVYQFMS
mgnify:CR=1 FL=1